MFRSYPNETANEPLHTPSNAPVLLHSRGPGNVLLLRDKMSAYHGSHLFFRSVFTTSRLPVTTFVAYWAIDRISCRHVRSTCHLTYVPPQGLLSEAIWCIRKICISVLSLENYNAWLAVLTLIRLQLQHARVNTLPILSVGFRSNRRLP